MDLLLQETDFGLHILQHQNLTESLVFSPLSIQLALYLLWSFSYGLDNREETLYQIRNALVKNGTDGELAQYFANNFFSGLDSSQNKTKINMHSLFAFPPKSYLDEFKKEFNAGATYVDLYVNTEENTLFNSLAIEPIFINPISFESGWQNGFSSGTTSKRNFYASASSKRRINFLHADHVRRNYSENDQFQVLSLPYKDNTYSMNIFLPKTRFGLKEALENLNSVTMQHLLSNVSETTVEIAIPKWKIETELKLKGTMQAIGITNFREKPDSVEKISIKDMTHNAFIEVDEHGTNVATANKMDVDISLPNVLYSEDPKKFIANHPFLYVLSKDNHPLFIGLHY